MRDWFLVSTDAGPFAAFTQWSAAEDVLGVEFWDARAPGTYTTLDGRYTGRYVSPGALVAVMAGVPLLASRGAAA